MNIQNPTLTVQQLFVLAGEMTRKLGHYYLGTEHTLLSLFEFPDCHAVKILEECGDFDPDQFQEALIESMNLDEDTWVTLEEPAVPPTPRLRYAIAEVMRGSNPSRLSTAHLLWGCLSIPGISAIDIFATFGVDAEYVADVAERLNLSPER